MILLKKANSKQLNEEGPEQTANSKFEIDGFEACRWIQNAVRFGRPLEIRN
jgi:hypothetical protein